MIYSPSIEAVFRGSGYGIEQMIRTVHRMGFQAFEFWGWWNKDIETIERVALELDLQVGSFCSKPISLLDPSLRSDFVRGVEESIKVAGRLRCRHLIAMTGNEMEGISRQKQRESAIEGLKRCVPLLERANVSLVLEPLNVKINHPGYFLSESSEAFEIVERVGSKAVRVLYDIYHQQVTEGDLTRTIEAHFQEIGYFHVADHPGRHEPGTGEIAYPLLMNKLQELGYEGFVGLEFFPKKTPEEGLRACMNYLSQR
jgi:hydroxypyruvate isomerase